MSPLPDAGPPGPLDLDWMPIIAELELFLAHEPRLHREIIKRGPGPWALALSPSGLRPLKLKQL